MAMRQAVKRQHGSTDRVAERMLKGERREGCLREVPAQLPRKDRLHCLAAGLQVVLNVVPVPASAA